MIRADLHIHSYFSAKSKEWYLKRVGARKSYTDPEQIYQRCLERGMDFVTLTDQNTIEGVLILKNRYPETVFLSSEVTAYFPEDDCKVHILVYGITESQFQKIQSKRKNIYQLRDYLISEKIAHSVAHPFVSVNGKLQVHHAEKLLVLFNHFEIRNGAHSGIVNSVTESVIRSLTPELLVSLSRKYRLDTYGENPHIKGLTGGSNDTSGLFMGQTWTSYSDPETAADKDSGKPDKKKGKNRPEYEDFLKALRRRETAAEGMSNNYKYMVFSLYKYGFDVWKSANASGNAQSKVVRQLTDIFFGTGPVTFSENMTLAGVRIYANFTPRGDRLKHHFLEIIKVLSEERNRSLTERMESAYSYMSHMADDLMRILFDNIEEDIKKGDLIKLAGNLSAALPGFLTAFPFFTTMGRISRGRQLLNRIEEAMSAGLAAVSKEESAAQGTPHKDKKILWFSDTLNDLNGVSVTLKKIGWAAYERKKDLILVTALTPEEMERSALPPNTLNLPFVYSFKLPYYERYIMKVPSLLRALEAVSEAEPDEIYISTPGPVGILGLIAAKLLQIKCTGIYHTDFTLQAKEIAGDESLLEFIENGTYFFYSQMDENRIPTVQYMNILEERGFNRSKMKLFRRGIDTEHFFPKGSDAVRWLESRFGVKDGVSFVFVGRISQDKNLSLLTDAYERLSSDFPDINLIFTGEGPYMDELRERTSGNPRVVFTGKLNQEELPDLYSACHALVFPSFTDTFGMAVLEAQTCGLPAIVSDQGGPQEIIIPGETGLVAKAHEVQAWISAMEKIVKMAKENPESYLSMREASRNLALQRNDWKVVINHYLEGEE